MDIFIVALRYLYYFILIVYFTTLESRYYQDPFYRLQYILSKDNQLKLQTICDFIICCYVIYMNNKVKFSNVLINIFIWFTFIVYGLNFINNLLILSNSNIKIGGLDPTYYNDVVFSRIKSIHLLNITIILFLVIYMLVIQ